MSKSSERIPISKRERFDIFRRDHFTCRYCGKSPPSVLLEIDHIVPVADGGTNVIENLATACQECNQGKADKTLIVREMSFDEKMTTMQERMEEIAAAEQAIKAAKLRKKARKSLADFFMETCGLTEMIKSNISGLSNLEREFGAALVHEWIEYAAARCSYASERNLIKYIYGCARRTREERSEHAEPNHP